MINDLLTQFDTIRDALHHTWQTAALIILLVIGVHALNAILDYRLNFLGIVPRRIPGLVGIVCSPFLHGNFNHLFFNCIPLFCLINFVLIEGMARFYWVTGCIMVMSGAAIWCFGRRAIHIGASSMILGYWAYLLVAAYFQGTGSPLLLGLVTLYYFGGMFTSLFPSDAKTSWEGHVFGAIAGGLTAYFL